MIKSYVLRFCHSVATTNGWEISIFFADISNFFDYLMTKLEQIGKIPKNRRELLTSWLLSKYSDIPQAVDFELRKC